MNNFEVKKNSPENKSEEGKLGLLKRAYRFFLDSSFSKRIKLMGAAALVNTVGIVSLEAQNQPLPIDSATYAAIAKNNEYIQTHKVDRAEISAMSNDVLDRFLPDKISMLTNEKVALEAELSEIRKTKPDLQRDYDEWKTKVTQYENDNSMSITGEYKKERIEDAESWLRGGEGALAYSIDQEITLEDSIQTINELLSNPDRMREEIRTDILCAFDTYDQEKAGLIEWIQSDAYLERLRGEFGGDLYLAEKYRKIRLEQVEKKDYVAVYGDRTELENYKNPRFITEGHYDKADSTVYLSTQARDGHTGYHEFTHQSEHGESTMTPFARDLYTKAYAPNEYLPQDEIEYYGRPGELGARKRQLEADLRELGIKEYGEKFTQDHYEKMIEASRVRGRLSEGAKEFIRMIKPEYFIQIMNEIAATEPMMPMNHMSEPGENDSEQRV